VPQHPNDAVLLKNVFHQAVEKLRKNMCNAAHFPDPERYREEALLYLEQQLTLALQQGQLKNNFTSILEGLDQAIFPEAVASRLVSSPPTAQPTPPVMLLPVTVAATRTTSTTSSSSKSLKKLLPRPEFTLTVIQPLEQEPEVARSVIQPLQQKPEVARSVIQPVEPEPTNSARVPVYDSLGLLMSNDLSADISANVRVSMANVRKGHCDACGTIITAVPEQFRAHVVNDHRLVVESLARADMAERVEKLCSPFAVPDRPGMYHCSTHELRVAGRDTLLQHLALEHEMIFHFLLVCQLYGTRDFVSCPFPECALKMRWSYDRYPSHLLQTHLKRYVEMEMVQAQKKCKTVRLNVCPREGCGFPQFLNLLVVHYANEHQVLQDVFKNFAKVNGWNTQQLQNYGFFKPSLRSNSGGAQSKDLVVCPRCGAGIQSTLICLHIDQCLEKGQLANYLRNQLKVHQVDLYQSYSCPVALCSSKPSLPFPQLFNHCLVSHNLYNMAAEQYRLYSRVNWPREIAPPAELPKNLELESVSITLVQPANNTGNKAPAPPVGKKVPRLNLGHIKSLVRAQVGGSTSASRDAAADKHSAKVTAAASPSRAAVLSSSAAVLSSSAAVLPSCAAGLPSTGSAAVLSSSSAVMPSSAAVLPKSAAVLSSSADALPISAAVLSSSAAHKAHGMKEKIDRSSTASYPVSVKESIKITDKISCPFSFGGIECPKTFPISGKKTAFACFEHFFIHVIVSNPNIQVSTMEKVKRMAALANRRDFGHCCPIPYCKMNFVLDKELGDHFSFKHNVEIVAIYLSDNSMHSLLQSLLPHTPKYFQGFLKKYQHWNSSATTPAQAAIMIQALLRIRYRGNP
jgi:hypothetical protein